LIVGAALCPSPPLLAHELTGQADILPELRDACTAAVTRLLAAAPDVVVVIGAADATAAWDGDMSLDLARYAPALAGARAKRMTPSATAGRSPSPAPDAARLSLPLSLGVGALLLDEAGYAGPRLLRAVAGSAAPADCAGLGAELADTPGQVAVLAVGDGTARRSLSAPGYLDDRAEPFDAVVERALRELDLPALAGLDPHLAADLMATNRAPLQVLAGVLGAASPVRPRAQSEVLYSDAPLGVAYLVAVIRLVAGRRLAVIPQPDEQLDP
jgi:hypothetical protein